VSSSAGRVSVDVRSNIVTLSGEVDRKSDVEVLIRSTRDLDGVVDVVDRLKYVWDDTVAPPTMFETSFRRL